MKKLARLLCAILSVALCVGCFSMVGCTPSDSNDDDKGLIRFSVQELDGVFNPYFATSGYDTEIVGNTQIGLLSSDDTGNIYCGTDEPSVALNYSQIISYDDGSGIKDYNADDEDPSKRAPVINGDPESLNGDEYYTTYRFLLKNGIRFSDGEPLTVKDVIFNLYALLDPAYYGSATVYSTKIEGLTAYRAQKKGATNKSDAESTINNSVRNTAMNRLNDLRYMYYPSSEDVRNSVRDTYKKDGVLDFESVKQNVLADVETARFMFYDEVMADWKAAKSELESYEEENKKAEEAGPDSTAAKAAKGFTEVWEIFCYNYGMITVETTTDEKGNTVIKTYEKDGEGYDKYGNKHKTGDKMIDYQETWKYFHDEDELYLPTIVFNNMLGLGDIGGVQKYEKDGNGVKEIANATLPKCDIIPDNQGLASGSSYKNSDEDAYWHDLWENKIMMLNLYSVITNYQTAGKLQEKFMGEALEATGSSSDMEVDRVEGIKILQLKPGDTFDGKYGQNTVDETSYVLQIRVDGVDPKAISNFGVTVAPMHYYSNVASASLTADEMSQFSEYDYDDFNYPVYDKDGNLIMKGVDGIYAGAKEEKGEIVENKRICPGLKFKSRDFFDKVVSNKNIIGVPVGAGMYQVSDVAEDDPYYLFEKDETTGDVKLDANGQPIRNSAKRKTDVEFKKDNMVFFIRNPFFFTTSGVISDKTNHINARNYADTDGDICNCKVKYIRYQIITSNKLLDSILNGDIDYGDPTANPTNKAKIDANKNYSSYEIENNGYGYIGINATYVPDLEVRRAIMMAMDTSMVKAYYQDSANIIYRPISTCSWASPENTKNPAYETVAANPDKYAKDYYPYTNENTLVNEIKTMIAGISIGGNKYNTSKTPNERRMSDGTTHKLEYTFTIAGSTDDHPAYATMQNAANILNKCGFKITVKTDANALSKLAAGTLEVWAAAWSSGVDPDMYQIYHEDSKATSVNNWGYPTILAKQTTADYRYQYEIISELSDLIDDGRSTLDQEKRAETYLEALNKIMELAVEYPIYQRKNLFVYNNKVIKRETLNPAPTPFSGLLAKMWEVEVY